MKNNIFKGVFLSVALLAAVFTVTPKHAYASFNPLNPIDPFCLFSCDDEPAVNNNTYYTNTIGSYNTNSNNRNTTYGSNSPITQTASTPVYNGSVYGASSAASAYVAPSTPSTPAYAAPVYNNSIYNSVPAATYVAPIVYNTPSYYATPTYNYNPPYYNYGNYNYNYSSPLSVSCYPTPTYASVGSSVSWVSSVSGGNGSNYITWSGTEGLYGNGSTITKAYSYSGTKNASITVTSGGQTVSQNCSGTVTVSDNGYYNNYGSYYNNYYNYNYPVTVSCSTNTTFAPVGTYVTWTANPSGSYNGYSYSWSGTDGLYGSQSSVQTYYSTPGVKTAYVTVYSNGQNISAQCSNSVTVGYPTGYNNGNQYGNSGVIQLACAAGVTSARVGTPVTWTAEAYGSTGRFIYSWSGTDNLFGTQSSAITSYATPGTKSAIVTVTSSNGQTLSRVCGNTVSIKANVVAAPKPATTIVQQPPQQPQVVMLPPNNSLFSLQNVPWGWVGVLVILVLMGMIFYLIFNKKKI